MIEDAYAPPSRLSIAGLFAAALIPAGWAVWVLAGLSTARELVGFFALLFIVAMLLSQALDRAAKRAEHFRLIAQCRAIVLGQEVPRS